MELKEIIGESDEPPSLQQEEVTGDTDRQSHKSTFRDLSWIFSRRRGLLASGMVIAVTDRLGRSKYLPMV